MRRCLLIDLDVLEVVRTVRRQGWRVGLLTNATDRLACRLMDATPDKCVFVDDRWENVSAAKEAGLQAHLFVGASSLAEVLGTPTVLRST